MNVLAIITIDVDDKTGKGDNEFSIAHSVEGDFDDAIRDVTNRLKKEYIYLQYNPNHPKKNVVMIRTNRIVSVELSSDQEIAVGGGVVQFYEVPAEEITLDSVST